MLAALQLRRRLHRTVQMADSVAAETPLRRLMCPSPARRAVEEETAAVSAEAVVTVTPVADSVPSHPASTLSHGPAVQRRNVSERGWGKLGETREKRRDWIEK